MDSSTLASLSIPLASLRMQALEAGPSDGPLVLLLHGFPELSESWREVLPLLGTAGYHAVAPDLRGYGGTDRPRKGYDLDTLADDVYQLARHLQPGRPVHLVGHDWGGAIAYHVAAMHPDVVATLTVVNCPHPSVLARRIWRPAQLRRSWYMFYFQLPWLPERALSAEGGRRVPALMRRGMAKGAQVSDARLAPYAENLAHPDAARAAVDYYREALRGLFTPGGARRLLRTYPRIRAPFRLVWGEEDTALGRELTVGLEPYFEQPPEVRYLAGVGHFPPLEAPERVASEILEHLERQPLATPRAKAGGEKIVAPRKLPDRGT
ncbi:MULTISPECIES: alpha/beta fold hydrolase [Myxococcus]|uniref:alpha/beta fold hydrolase n=1 Tax=Myxococcus TaxID=32 RepID=UPI0013D3B7C6|nr:MULTISPECIES: alpha/beta fold hydrolase [Myxococcus]NVJ24196.1 alpha/beta fold hydrolase [Myxococcus sp. AM011]